MGENNALGKYDYGLKMVEYNCSCQPWILSDWISGKKKVNITPTVHLTMVFVCSHREHKNQLIVWEI